MKIKTQRLELVALNPHQLQLWIEDIVGLEEELNVTYDATPLEGDFLEIVKMQWIKATQDPENYMWHTFWFLVCKKDRIVVGAADFKDVPNDKHEVEIGYGLGGKYQHQGYMTEAVDAMCSWALKQNNVYGVIAETETDKMPTQMILKRCGFKIFKEGETLWWKL